MPNSDEVFLILGKAWSFELIQIDGKAVSVGSILTGVVAIGIGIWVARRLSRWLSRIMGARLSVEHSALGAIETFSFYLLAIIFAVFGMSLANIPMTVFTVAGGALAIGVGFGSQNVISNFISGLILLIERPIRVDDFVELDGIFGKVERIGFRSTTVNAVGNRQLIVPNSSFLEKNVLNWTLADRVVRTRVMVGVAYGSPTRKVEELLNQAVRTVKGALEWPAPLILFKEFADSSLNFEVTFSIEIKEIRDREVAASNLRFAIDELFRQGDIVIAFPQRDLHLSTESPLEIQLRSAPESSQA